MGLAEVIHDKAVQDHSERSEPRKKYDFREKFSKFGLHAAKDSKEIWASFCESLTKPKCCGKWLPFAQALLAPTQALQGTRRRCVLA